MSGSPPSYRSAGSPPQGRPSGAGGRPSRPSTSPAFTGSHERIVYTPAYSHFVIWMKIVLPLIAALLLALVVAWPYLQQNDALFRLGFSALTMSDTQTPGMVNVRYVGADNKGQPFSITADLARSRDKTASVIDLELPKADITLKDGSWVALTADTGQYQRGANTLDLKGRVDVFHDSGYELKTAEAKLDLKRGTVLSHTAVYGQGPIGEIHSEGMSLLGKGKIIIFTGKTRLILYPGVRKDASSLGALQK